MNKYAKTFFMHNTACSGGLREMKKITVFVFRLHLNLII